MELLEAVLHAILIGLIAGFVTWLVLWLVSKVITIEGLLIRNIALAVGVLVALLELLKRL